MPRTSLLLIAALAVGGPLAGQTPQPGQAPQPTATQQPSQAPQPSQPPTPAQVPPPPASTPQQPRATTMPQPPVPEVQATPTSDPDRETAVMMLQRIATLVDGALAEKPSKSDQSPVGTSGKRLGNAGTVRVDRATLDEIRAAAAQIETMLRRGGQPPR